MEDPNNRKDDQIMKVLKDLARTAIISLIIIVVLTQFFIRPFRVNGRSMEPTIANGGYGFSSIISYKLSGLSRFDVVVFCQDSRDECLIKRVIGLPGETVMYQEDKLYINGEYIEEKFFDFGYVSEQLTARNLSLFTNDFGPIEVSEGEYFVMGDNRLDSVDSRYFGSINEDEIKSKYAIVIYPFTRFNIVTDGD